MDLGQKWRGEVKYLLSFCQMSEPGLYTRDDAAKKTDNIPAFPEISFSLEQ